MIWYFMGIDEAQNRNVFRRWRKVDRDRADITLSGRLLQVVGLTTGKARPPTADSYIVWMITLLGLFETFIHNKTVAEHIRLYTNKNK